MKAQTVKYVDRQNQTRFLILLFYLFLIGCASQEGISDVLVPPPILSLIDYTNECPTFCWTDINLEEQLSQQVILAQDEFPEHIDNFSEIEIGAGYSQIQWFDNNDWLTVRILSLDNTTKLVAVFPNYIEQLGESRWQTIDSGSPITLEAIIESLGSPSSYYASFVPTREPREFAEINISLFYDELGVMAWMSQQIEMDSLSSMHSVQEENRVESYHLDTALLKGFYFYSDDSGFLLKDRKQGFHVASNLKPWISISDMVVEP